MARVEIITRLSDRKVDLADLKLIEQHTKDLSELLSAGELAQRKTFIKSFVKEIRVTRNQCEILHRIPLPTDDTKRKKAEVLPFIPLGSAYGIRTRVRIPF